jgi:hypothetical protein
LKFTAEEDKKQCKGTLELVKDKFTEEQLKKMVDQICIETFFTNENNK